MARFIVDIDLKTTETVMNENTSLLHIIIIHLLLFVNISLMSSGEVQTVGKLKYMYIALRFIA